MNEVDDNFFLITSIFICFFINILINNNFHLQAMILGCESSPIEIFMETYIQSDDCQKRMQQLVDNGAQYFVVC
jgi:hypothetical protein